MTLTEFLLARIEEDEAWASQAPSDFTYAGAGEDHATLVDFVSHCMPPSRVLAECEAKRRIVATRPVEVLSENPQAWRLHDHVLRLLASAYADHADYRQEWRP